jgi:hypothetical protein
MISLRDNLAHAARADEGDDLVGAESSPQVKRHLELPEPCANYKTDTGTQELPHPEPRRPAEIAIRPPGIPKIPVVPVAPGSLSG